MFTSVSGLQPQVFGFRLHVTFFLDNDRRLHGPNQYNKSSATGMRKLCNILFFIKRIWESQINTVSMETVSTATQNLLRNVSEMALEAGQLGQQSLTEADTLR